jgi:hypothetical protein
MPAWVPITKDGISPSARIYADRYLMMEALAPSGGTVLEIGIGFGAFSEKIIQSKSPNAFIAVDTFDMHHTEIVWGVPTKEQFGGRTHEAYYRSRIKKLVKNLQVLVGFSSETLPTLPDASCDFIYVDGAHDYENVFTDAAHSARLLAPGGTIIFNDYVMMDVHHLSPYGIVQAVNEFVNTGQWEVVGFALEPNMFCDIAVRRR